MPLATKTADRKYVIRINKLDQIKILAYFVAPVYRYEVKNPIIFPDNNVNNKLQIMANPNINNAKYTNFLLSVFAYL